jgi:DNA polymerase
VKVNKYISYDADDDFLKCKLPSGRYIYYHKPLLEEFDNSPWQGTRQYITFMSAKMGQTFRDRTWNGKLTENVVQAIARDLLCHSMVELDKRGYNLIDHIHDEVVAQVLDKESLTITEYDRILEIKPEWAEGLPLAAEGWEGTRFRKD